HAAGQPKAFRGARPASAARRGLPGLLRAARGGAGAADRRTEKRAVGGPAVGLWLLCQRLAAAAARSGLRLGGAVPPGRCLGAGGGVCLGGHARAAAAEGAGGGGSRRAAGSAAAERSLA